MGNNVLDRWGRSMAKNLDKLRSLLSSTKDGSAACNAINKLTKLAQNGDPQAKNILAEYVVCGAIDHMRDHACGSLAEIVTESDAEVATVFQKGLSDPNLRYWSILGYMNSAGRKAYGKLVKIAKNKKFPLNERAHAIKCLATFSKQPFDRNLPSDPDDWEREDLRLTEVMAWVKDGYQDGQGYSEPIRHPALDNPGTAFEKIVSRLDKKLAKKRRKHQDMAAPSAWLAVASPEDIQRIVGRWKLPSTYLDFLTRFSPVGVTLESRRFYNHFQIFGAGELIEAQDGYSYNPMKQRPIEDWPESLVVIANHGGDPFVLDLSKSDGEEAPVETAEHGMGAWEFTRVSNSFTGFLKIVEKCK